MGWSVQTIRQIFDKGRFDVARQALLDLLDLGPHNVEALKMLAALYGREGRFGEESVLWDRISRIDPEDQDAVAYYYRRYREEREHFYFTDDLGPAGRRFLAYPRRLLMASALGLMGCCAFLLLVQSTVLAIPRVPVVIYSLFGLLVLFPWAVIIFSYLRSIRSVIVSGHGIEVEGRFRRHRFDWSEIDRVVLAHSNDPDSESLDLVLIPKAPEAQCWVIDLTNESSVIRTRSYLIAEVAHAFNQPAIAAIEELGLEERITISF